MKDLKSGSLEIVMGSEGGIKVMSWIGKSDDANPKLFLNPYLDSLIDDLQNSKLTVNFKKLDYMNSSTVPPIVRFIKNLDANKVVTTIVYDEHSNWQPMSFKALETLAVMMTHITVRGE